MLMHDSAVLDEDGELSAAGAVDVAGGAAAYAPVSRHLAGGRRISAHLIRGTAHSALRFVPC